MKIRFRILFMLTAATLAAVSCAKKNDEDYNVVEQASLDAWMKINAPDAQKLDNGMYIETVTPAPEGAAAPAIGNWVRINYTGKSLEGNVFVTRYKKVAEQQGTSTLHTYYEPQYLLYQNYNTSFTQGQLTALQQMRQGQVVTIYMPSSLAYGAYGSSYSGGYEGQYALSANVPAIMTMELNEVVTDPTARETGMVMDYAVNEWAIERPEKDSTFFFKIIEGNEDEKTKITVDSTVSIYYIGSFLDGFIFDTNIDSVAQRVFNDYDENSATSYTPKDGGMIQAFYEAVPRMHYGDRAKMVFTSEGGYGSTGNSSGETVIQPYTPLVFEFWIETNQDEEEEEDGDDSGSGSEN